jgi:hypothetical protein
MATEPVYVTLLVVDILETLNVPYLIGGSFASTSYGRVRTTQDVDIVAALEQQHVTPLITALGDAFYADEQVIRQAIERRTSCNLIHQETMFKVDIFIPKLRPFDRQQLARRVERVIDRGTARKAFFASVEDIVLAKLEWYRLGGEVSERQWQDIQSILQLQWEALDRTYLSTAAGTLRVSDLLERALGEAAR